MRFSDRSMPSLETESESEAKIDETATENETETETENDTEAETEPAAGRKREVSGRRGNQNPKPVETASDSEAKSDDESEPVKGTRTLRGKAGAQQTATKNAKTTVRSPPKSQQGEFVLLVWKFTISLSVQHYRKYSQIYKIYFF